MFSAGIWSRLCLCSQSRTPCWAGVAFGAYAQVPWGWGIKIPLVDSAVKTLQKNPSVIPDG